MTRDEALQLKKGSYILHTVTGNRYFVSEHLKGAGVLRDMRYVSYHDEKGCFYVRNAGDFQSMELVKND